MATDFVCGYVIWKDKACVNPNDGRSRQALHKANVNFARRIQNISFKRHPSEWQEMIYHAFIVWSTQIYFSVPSYIFILLGRKERLLQIA